MSIKNSTVYRTWGKPILLGLITVAGLLLAIMGTGLWHVFSWIALGIPVYAMTFHGIKYFR